ncbi:MAG: hypothetical protein WAM16_09115 [Nitrososphaeraceae archaeon]
MSSEENFRRLGTSIIMLEEKLEELKTYHMRWYGIDQSLIQMF